MWLFPDRRTLLHWTGVAVAAGMVTAAPALGGVASSGSEPKARHVFGKGDHAPAEVLQKFSVPDTPNVVRGPLGGNGWRRSELVIPLDGLKLPLHGGYDRVGIRMTMCATVVARSLGSASISAGINGRAAVMLKVETDGPRSSMTWSSMDGVFGARRWTGQSDRDCVALSNYLQDDSLPEEKRPTLYVSVEDIRALRLNQVRVRGPVELVRFPREPHFVEVVSVRPGGDVRDGEIPLELVVRAGGGAEVRMDDVDVAWTSVTPDVQLGDLKPSVDLGGPGPDGRGPSAGRTLTVRGEVRMPDDTEGAVIAVGAHYRTARVTRFVSVARAGNNSNLAKLAALVTGGVLVVGAALLFAVQTARRRDRRAE